ncbi:TadE/TadG family type IV pilus assembly protein [Yoonia sp.]|uniref:TadE/TadG family type IV pilus assembly protein n=1 Tax=Yoonia sp. TaxID=2212373 RepID=UPI0019E772AB|nr:TadE/TadG family type IV pilus assembly protein [Yoonia sp.]MBE0414494.1 pilus assembly protein [Yoonia sp.]
MLNATRNWMRRFSRNEDGSATIESLFWIPVFVYFLVLVLDVSFIFFGKAQVLQVVQDANRALSINVLTTEEETEEFVRTSLLNYATHALINSRIDLQTGVVTTDVLVPASDFMVVGSIPVFGSTMIPISAQHFLER